MAIPDPTTIFTSLKLARGVIQQFEDTPLKAQVIEMQRLIMDIQGAAMEMQESLRSAKDEIRELKDAAAERALVEYDRKAYWTGPNRSEICADGPFCTSCYDTQKLLVRMGFYIHSTPKCPQCKHVAEVWPENPGNAYPIVR